ncbi:MAG: hypothetical protein ACYC2O_09565 [Microthrixaceae bacterium]
MSRLFLVVVGFVLGMIWSLLVWGGLRSTLARPVFRRTNYRGAELSTAAGLAVPVAVWCSGAVVAVVVAMGARPDPFAVVSMQMTAVAVGGFGLLGLLDDLAVDEGASGYRGHLTALFSGRLSAGALKMIVGPAVALVVVQPASGDSFWWLLLDGAIVALAANVANLFDRAPGRVTKVATICGAALLLSTVVGGSSAVAYLAPGLFGVAIVLGAAWALLMPELREEMMLGDAGANPIGAALGLAVVLTQSQTVRVVTVVVLLLLNLLSERVSFSAVIDRVGPLRAVDRLGRRPVDGAGGAG